MKKNYPKLIKKAVNYSNKDKKLMGNELYFYDHLDWGIVKDKTVWTDVFLMVGGDSVFAFTVSSSFTNCGFLQGSVPESFRNIEDGTWNLYIHSKYISHNMVGKACLKWTQLQGKIPEICLGPNIYFNDKHYGYAWIHDIYPPERDYPTIKDI